MKYWNINPNYVDKISIKSFDENNKQLAPKFERNGIQVPMEE